MNFKLPRLINDGNIIIRYEKIWIIVCHVVFFGLCLYFLENRPLWSDEIITIITVRRPFIDGLLQLQDYSAPLYQLILRLVVTNDHPPEWLIRAPAVFYGIMGLSTSWLFTRKLFGPEIALLTIVLLTINPVYIQYSTEGRPYSLLVLFSVLSMLNFYNLLSYYNKKNLIFYIISTIFLGYSHYLGIIIFIGQFSYVISDFLITRKKFANLKLILFGFGCILIFLLPALFAMSRYMVSGALGAVGWIEKPTPAAFFNIGPLFGSSIVSVYFILALIVGVWRQPFYFDGKYLSFNKGDDINLSKWWAKRSKTLLCLWWIMFNFSIVIIISMAIRPIYVGRYFLPSVIPISILIAIFINKIKGKFQYVTLILLVSILLCDTYYKKPLVIAQYPQLVKYLSNANNAESEIFVSNLAYCEKYINPEIYGLRYYGLTDNNFNLLKINYPYNISICEPEKLPVNKRILIVCRTVSGKIEEYFNYQGRAHRKISFGSIIVIEVEKQGSVAYWFRCSS
jgi:mannosyltransferase